jgi:hypothetical protein
MTPERRDSGARRDDSSYVAANKHASLAMSMHATTEVLLKAVFSMQFVLTVQ